MLFFMLSSELMQVAETLVAGTQGVLAEHDVVGNAPPWKVRSVLFYMQDPNLLVRVHSFSDIKNNSSQGDALL